MQHIVDQKLIQTILECLPGLILVMNKYFKCIYTNSQTAKMFGYPSTQEMIGLDPYQICSVESCAKQFIAQDKYVQKTGHAISFLNIHRFPNGLAKLFITKKVRIMLKRQIYSISHLTEIDKSYDIPELYLDPNQLNTIPHTLDDRLGLSDREIQCLYYLLRGKTMKQIAKNLDISWRTVEAHFNKIKLKWGCQNKSELIETATLNGLGNFTPNSIKERV